MPTPRRETTGQNFPVLTVANVVGSAVGFIGTITGKANTTYRIEFFSSSSCDASGNGQGETFLGLATAVTDATCSTNFNASLPFPAGQTIFTATATDASSDPNGLRGTSEFSPCFDSGAVAVTSISPSSGPASGISGAVATGANFASGATVTVGGLAAANVVFLDPTQVSFDVPSLAPGAVYPVTATVPGPSSGTLTNGWFADFLDVPGGLPIHPFVEKLVRNSITAGCGGGNYCPGDSAPARRWRSFCWSKEGRLHAAGLRDPDVRRRALLVRIRSWVDELRPRRDGGLRRRQLLPDRSGDAGADGGVSAAHARGSAYTPPACVTPTFADVPCSSAFAPWIDELALRGITAGCGGGNYCPATPVTRGQMAVFLVVTFALP